MNTKSVTKTEELRPCPFCGGKAITATFLDYDDLDYMALEVNDSESIDGEVTCENEHCINGWWLPPELWNTRPIEDALQAHIAELKDFIDKLIEIGEWGVTGLVISNSFSCDGMYELAKRRLDEWQALVRDWKER